LNSHWPIRMLSEALILCAYTMLLVSGRKRQNEMKLTYNFEDWTAGMLLAACITTISWAGVQETAPHPASGVNRLLGQWARSVADCSHPEFTFDATTASIYLEADGTPTSLKYPRVTYVSNGDEITVTLNARHPIGKTPQKDALQFAFKDDDHASLQLLKQKSVSLVRCAAKATK